MKIFQPFPTIQTERLTLRQLRTSDQEEILFLRSDEQITFFIHRKEEEKTKTLADAEAFIEMINTGLERGDFITWGICIKGESSIVGTICLWNFSDDGKTAELGYDLKPNFQGKGYMRESMDAVLRYGFTQLKLQMIEAFTHRDNEPSLKLLKHHGFVLQQDRKDDSNAYNVILELENPYGT